MEKSKVVQLLQYRRHDLVNDIQVIHAYARMNRLEKVQEKLDEFIEATKYEQNLHMLAAPSFILWMEMFRMDYRNNFKLSYEIRDVFNLRNFDEWITKQCEKLMKEVQKHINNEQMYNLHVCMYKDSASKCCIELRIDPIDVHLYERLGSFIQQKNNASFTCTYAEEQLLSTIQIDGLIEGE